MATTGRLNTEGALRMLDLALASAGTNDMAMSIENNGAPVEGESPRQYSDGKHRLDVLGYILHAMRDPSGGTNAQLLMSHLHIVRRSDAATASIASLMRLDVRRLRLTLSIYRAGGDPGREAEPMVQYIFNGARVAEIALLTGGATGVPCEIVRFAFRTLRIESASQTRTGARSAVRSCEYGDGASEFEMTTYYD